MASTSKRVIRDRDGDRDNEMETERERENGNARALQSLACHQSQSAYNAATTTANSKQLTVNFSGNRSAA